MESPAPAAGPCVYMPISHPDSPVPTYAVLQVLGISPAPHSPLHPQLITPSLHHLHPGASPASSPPSPVSKLCASSAESTNSSVSSSSEEREKRFPSLGPTHMKKSASASGLSPTAHRRSAKMLPCRPTISITHTDKDTIIHTVPSDFRKVVHQLTGATNGEKGLMPITFPARMTPSNRSGAGSGKDSSLPASTALVPVPPCLTRDNAGGSDNTKYVDSASISRPPRNASANLLERRKSNKVLGRLLTRSRNIPPLLPSPVTPLASDFDKISLPVTPSSSEGSLTPCMSLSPLSHGTRAMATLAISGAAALHSNGSMATLSLSQRAKDSLLEIKLCCKDAMDMQPPETSQTVKSQSLSLRSREDEPLAGSVQIAQSTKSQNRVGASEADGLSLALAPATGALLNATDMGNEEGRCEHEDAMDLETLRGSTGMQDSSAAMRPSCLADEEGSAIAQESFFFQSARPQNGNPTLLALFPQSSR